MKNSTRNIQLRCLRVSVRVCTPHNPIGRFVEGNTLTQENKITHPLDLLSKLDYSTTRMMSVPNRASLERSDRQLSENVSFGVDIALGAE